MAETTNNLLTKLSSDRTEQLERDIMQLQYALRQAQLDVFCERLQSSWLIEDIENPICTAIEVQSPNGETIRTGEQFETSISKLRYEADSAWSMRGNGFQGFGFTHDTLTFKYDRSSYVYHMHPQPADDESADN